MTATLATTPPGTDVLGELVARRRDEDQAARDVLMLAVRYAAQHPAPGVTADEAVYGDQPLELAGPGAPGISEFAVMEYAAALGLTQDAARRYLGRALEAAHRLPKVWALVEAGKIPAWRATVVAERTIPLSEEGALYVDKKVAERAGRVGPGILLRLVDEARLLSEEPEEDWTFDLQARRRVQIDTRGMAVHGIAYVDAALDIPDALDLEKALQAAAAALKDTHGDLTRDQRRSIALGEIARTYLAQTGEAPAGGGVQLYVHYAPDSDLGRRGRVRVENTQGLTTLDQIAEWLARPGMTVKVTPVIDLPETAEIEPGSTSGERLPCRHGPASTTDPEDSSDQMLEPGYYLWHSPTGRRYLRTPTGTIALE